ncbi:MAG: hypothetical protein AB1529_01650 [Candidatus Micrarchaeota archaeon]
MSLEDLPPQKLQKAVLEYFGERFGLGAGAFEPYGLYLGSKGRVFLGPKQAIPKPRIVTIGLLVARVTDSIKPTTNLLQCFGKQVTKNAIELGREQALAYARGADLMLNEGLAASDGYVLLRYKGHMLGCGHLRGRAVKNMLPKAKRLDLRFI